MARYWVATLIAVVAITSVALAAGSERQDRFRAQLTGSAAGVDTRAQGEAVFELNRDGTGITYKLRVTGLENVTMAHIHWGELGKNGPPVVWLYPVGVQQPQEKPGKFSGVLAEGTIDASSLIGPLAGRPLSDLINGLSTGEAYVNIHTTDHPAGELRGQVELVRPRPEGTSSETMTPYHQDWGFPPQGRYWP